MVHNRSILPTLGSLKLTTMSEAIGGALYAAKNAVEGAVLVAKGIYDPTLPLRANLRPITDVNVPVAYHTLSVIKGRAYLFGGRTLSKEGTGEELADNDVHVVILPTTDFETTDYQRIEAQDGAPPRRYGHSASVIEERIYVFGGCGEDGEPLDEGGRVWVFDTVSKKWSHFDPPKDGEKPEPRSSCASVASEHPRPLRKRPDEGTLPQDPPDPESVMPEIPAPDTYGTVIIQGGQGKGGSQLNDVWTFDISTRSWRQLPDTPPPTTSSPSLAMVGSRLYTFSAGQTSYLDLTQSSFDDMWGKGELGLAPLGPWQSVPPTSSSPEELPPGERTGAPMIPVTTGQGRNYLLLIGGESQAGETEEDIWAFQLNPEGMTAASFKDAARMAMSKDTDEQKWSEVQYHNAEGVMIQEGQPGRGIGARKGLAASKDTGVDNAGVVLWGGIGADGKVRGDGLMISVDR